MNAADRAIDYHKRWREAEAEAEALAEALEPLIRLWKEGRTEQAPGAFLNARDTLARYRGEK